MYYRLLQAALFLAATCFASAATAQQGTFLYSSNVSDATRVLTIDSSLREGDLLRFFYQDAGAGEAPATVALNTVTINGSQVCSGAACSAFEYPISTAGTYTIVASSQATSGNSFVFYAQCNGAFIQSIPGTYSDACTVNNVSVTQDGSGGGNSGGTGTSTTAQDPDEEAQGRATARAAGAAGAGSANATGSAINQAIGGRNAGPRARVTQDAVFLSTSGETTGVNAWAHLSGRSFHGDLEGSGGDLTLGMDWEIGTDAILGLALSYSRYTLKSDGADYDTRALAIGPYFSTRLSNATDLDLYLLFAKPSYDADGGDFTSERVIGGIDLSLGYDLSGLQGSGYFRLSGFREDLPSSAPGGSRIVSQAMASLGTRIDFAPDAAFRPHVSIGADVIRFDDGDAVLESVSPHLGLGFEADSGPGVLSFTLDGGEVFDDARSTGFGIRYEARF